jgi:selenocysteine lyase/cysteine desulfurase
MLDMIPSQRHLFDLPDEIAYLNCAYMGPLMHAVVEAGRQGIARKARPWTLTQEDFFNESWQARELFARIVNADPQAVGIIPSASYGIETAARNLPLAAGRRIIVLAEQFPSNIYPWQRRAQQCGASLHAVRSETPETLSDAVMAAIDERTAVVALGHCRWTDGALLDLPAIAARCRDVGSALALDLTQSAGVLPVDVAALQPDFLVAACYKWLLGPYSLGFVAVHPRWHDGEPLEQNWIARSGSEDFSALVDYATDYQPGAQRFDMGERASFHLMPMAVTAMRQILEWGVPAIAETLAARTAAIQAQLEALGLRCPPGHARAGHFLSAQVPGGIPAGLLQALAEQGIYISQRGSSLRVTPHVYNTDEDAARLVAALRQHLA